MKDFSFFRLQRATSDLLTRGLTVVGMCLNFEAAKRFEKSVEDQPTRKTEAANSIMGIPFWEVDQEEDCVLFYDRDKLNNYLKEKGLQ